MDTSILVTGASGNLGHAVVRKLVREGFQVLATGSRADGLDGAEVVSVNLTEKDQVQAFIHDSVQKYPDLQVAVLLVGGFAGGDLLSTGTDQIQQMIKLNFDTAYHVVQALLPEFKRKGGGQFVLIGSKAGLSGKDATQALAYGFSKSLILYLAEVINAYGKHLNIQASVVVPGIIDTPPNREAMPDADFAKWTTPEAIADSIHFLLTDSGKHLRNTVLQVSNES